MKFKFKECCRELSLEQAVLFVQINSKVHYKGITLELKATDTFDDSFLIITIEGKLTIFQPSCYLSRVLKSLHYFVHHKWLFKYESVGLVHCLFDNK